MQDTVYTAGDASLIPESGKSPGEGSGNSSVLAWKITRTEEPGGLQSMGSQRIGHMTEELNHHHQDPER